MKIVNGFQALIIFAKSSYLDVWQGFEYASFREETGKYQNEEPKKNFFLVQQQRRDDNLWCNNLSGFYEI